MNDQTDFVSKVTLECMMNKEQYAKYLDKIPRNKINKKDKKFYRKRIFDLTKQLINNEVPDNLMPDVKSAFDNYIHRCIDFFKILDKTDILQEDYIGINTDIVDPKNEINVDDIGNTTDANNLMMRSIKITNQNSVLDNFVKFKSIKVKNDPIIPKQKDINLKDPALKNKGIRKKKNISNNYETDPKKEGT